MTAAATIDDDAFSSCAARRCPSGRSPGEIGESTAAGAWPLSRSSTLPGSRISNSTLDGGRGRRRGRLRRLRAGHGRARRAPAAHRSSPAARDPGEPRRPGARAPLGGRRSRQRRRRRAAALPPDGGVQPRAPSRAEGVRHRRRRPPRRGRRRLQASSCPIPSSSVESPGGRGPRSHCSRSRATRSSMPRAGWTGRRSGRRSPTRRGAGSRSPSSSRSCHG